MASPAKQARLLARQFFKLSLEDGAVSSDRVSGILAYIEKHRPAHPLALLKAYRRLVAAELAKSQALVEHAGDLPPAALESLAGSLSKKYSRKVSASATPNPALLAGLRIRVGDDIYESSVSGQLEALAAAL